MGNTNPDPEAGNLADEPEMKALSRMIDAGEVDPDRTLDYLKAKTETGLEKKSDGGGGGQRFEQGLRLKMDFCSYKIQ